MPLGVGVFNNPWESIAKGMALAVEMLTVGEPAKLEIRALTWNGSSSEGFTMCELLSRHNKLVNTAATDL